MGATIHPLAVVDPAAELADGVEIGPFCTIGPKVKLAAGVRLVSHVSIAGNTSVGSDTLIFPFASLGHPPQDVKYKGEDTRLVIGSNNVIREHITMHLGTPGGRGVSVIGDRGFFMSGAHFGHDCIIGNNVTIASNASLGGFSCVDDFAIMGGLSAMHQFCRIGRYAFVGGGAPVTGDVIPFGMVDNLGRLNGLNLVGLKRRGYARDAIYTLRAAYRDLFHGEGHFEDRLTRVAETYAHVSEVMMIVDFIRSGEKRPLCLPRPD